MAFAAIFLAAVVPVLCAPVLPMIDFYSHVARYYVLAHVHGDPFLAENYAPRWAVLPNIGMDVIGVGVIGLLPPLATAKLLVVLIFAAEYFGVLIFAKRLNGEVSLLQGVLAAALLFSFILTWGFANFLLGLGLVFWAASWWLTMRERPAIAIPVACVLALIVFFVHGVAFALYGLTLGGLELGFFWQSRPRRWSVLFKRLAGLAAQAILPAALFLMSPTVADPKGLTDADESFRRLAKSGELAQHAWDLILYRLCTIVRVSESPWLWLDIAAFVLVAALLGALVLRRAIAVNRLAWPAVGIGLVLIALTPPDLFGVGNVADRMPLYTAFLVVGALTVRPLAARLDRRLAGAIAVVIGLRLVATGVGWQAYERDMASLRTVLSAIPRHSLVGFVDPTNGQRTRDAARCEMFGPLVISVGGDATSMFAYAGQQPIALQGRVKAAVEATRDEAENITAAERASRRLTMIGEGKSYDYALVCMPEALPAPPPANVRLIARDGRLAMYRVAR